MERSAIHVLAIMLAWMDLIQDDAMPLTCAEQQLQTASAHGLEQNRLLRALLESHNARRTWRTSKSQSSTSASSKEPQNVSFTATVPASSALPEQPLPTIVSFSGSFHTQRPQESSLQQQQEDDDPEQTDARPEQEQMSSKSKDASMSAVCECLAVGITLDTPE